MNRFDRYLEMCHGLETDFIKVFYYEFPDYYKDIYRSYEYHRVCTIIEGNKLVEVDKMDSFVYNENQFIVLPPESTVSMEISTPTRALVLEISDKLIEDISSKICLELEIGINPVDNDDNPIFKKNNAFIKDELNKITATALSGMANKEFLIDLYVQEMTYKLLNCMGHNMIIHGQTDNPIGKAIEIMKNSAEQDIDIAGIASSLGMSPPSFSMKFKKITGLSPIMYFTNIKMNLARKLLKNKSVTEVSFDLGYDNISHFIRLFNEKFGITPKQYQKNLQNGML